MYVSQKAFGTNTSRIGGDIVATILGEEASRVLESKGKGPTTETKKMNHINHLTKSTEKPHEIYGLFKHFRIKCPKVQT